MHGSGETVCGAVADLDDLLLGLELADGADWAEDLFLHDLHVLGDVREDGGLDEVTLVAVALAANLDLGACTLDRKSTRLNSSHSGESRMPSSA